MQHRLSSPFIPRVVLLSLVLVASAIGCAVGVTPNEPNGTDDAADAGTAGSSTDAGSKAESSAKPSSTADADTTEEGDAATTSDDAATAPPDDAALACPGYALPNESGPCHACQQSSSTCQPNGCYGGYYCDVAAAKCHPKPSGC